MTALFSNNRFMIISVILVTILIILSGLFYAISYFGEDEEDVIEEIEIIVIDDQISPLVTQGLTVEIIE